MAAPSAKTSSYTSSRANQYLRKVRTGAAYNTHHIGADREQHDHTLKPSDDWQQQLEAVDLQLRHREGQMFQRRRRELDKLKRLQDVPPARHDVDVAIISTVVLVHDVRQPKGADRTTLVRLQVRVEEHVESVRVACQVLERRPGGRR